MHRKNCSNEEAEYTHNIQISLPFYSAVTKFGGFLLKLRSHRWVTKNNLLLEKYDDCELEEKANIYSNIRA